jgi:prepilin-type N-terminal cleavage/methylation domain-containing protein
MPRKRGILCFLFPLLKSQDGEKINEEKGMLERGRVLSGFTVLEVMISLSIVAVILSTAWVSFFHTSHKYRLQRALWEIHSKMNYSRFKAVFCGTKFRISFDTNGYILERYDQGADIWKMEMKNKLEGVHVEANNSPVFYPEGTVSNLASLTVSNRWGTYKITLAISGRIKTVRLQKN